MEKDALLCYWGKKITAQSVLQSSNSKSLSRTDKKKRCINALWNRNFKILMYDPHALGS